MRRRLVVSTLLVVVVVIGLFGVPLGVIQSRALHQAAVQQLGDEAERLERVVGSHVVTGPADPVVARLAPQLSSGRWAEITSPTRPPIVIGHVLQQSGALRASRAIVGGQTLVVFERDNGVDAEIETSALLIGAAALVAVLAAVAMAVLQARRINRPLLELAATAERLGAGDARPRRRRYGVPELDRVAEVLDNSAERIARMLTAERRLAADASHQLRTPLTALSMRLEEIIATDEPDTVQEEAAIALTQVERLTDVVDRLLTAPRGAGRSGFVSFRVDVAIRQQVDEWRPAYASARREIRLTGTRGLYVIGTPGSLAQVLATLLENALIHGGGAVTVRTRMAGMSVVIEVTDEGQGVPRELGARIFERSVSGRDSTGLGLAVARDLAEADGARLELVQQKPPVFAIFMASGTMPEPMEASAADAG